MVTADQLSGRKTGVSDLLDLKNICQKIVYLYSFVTKIDPEVARSFSVVISGNRRWILIFYMSLNSS